MCFSTAASFASGAILTVIGVVAIKKVTYKKQILFASIPFVFAVQQFAEGFVWLSLLNDTSYFWRQSATYSFLFFALIIWPSWVPLSMLLMEKKPKRKIVLSVFFGLGLLFSILSVIDLLLHHTEAQLTAYHIHYKIYIPQNLKIIIGILYFIPTVVSNFVSSTKCAVLMGVFVLLSYIVSRLFFNDYVISVWCFFSALISIKIYFIVAKDHFVTTKDNFTKQIHH